MSAPYAFRTVDNWSGGFYELAIEVGPRSDARLQRVLTAVWSAADVQGCFGDRSREPREQEPVECTVEALARFGHLQGQVRLPTGELVVCGCVAIPEDGADGVDWLDFYIPLGALDRTGIVYHESGRQFYRSRVLDDWLAAVGTEAFRTADFRAGYIGWETSGCTYAATLNGLMPKSRSIGYLLPQDGELRYGAANTDPG
ncbi:hypothetical protein [Embleya sp. NPDC001921]